MRPTIDEQLDGVLRLLDALGRDEDLSGAGHDRLQDAARLVRRVRGAWSTSAPFLVEDSAALAALLHDVGAAPPAEPGPAAATDVTALIARNERLRAHLSATIRALPSSPDGDRARARIGAYLRRRVDTDPT